jgi:hypothetical protein
MIPHSDLEDGCHSLAMQWGKKKAVHLLLLRLKQGH